MPEVTLAQFNLSPDNPAALEQRRRAIVTEMTTKYKGYDDPDLPDAILQELVAITSALRAKTARPPAKAKPEKGTAKVAAKRKTSTDDIAGLF